MIAGVNLQPTEPFGIDLEVAWNSADAAFQQFDYFVDPGLMNPNQSYDFNQTHLNSDLDLSRFEASAELQYRFKDSFWLGGTYRWIDFSDDAPYRGDVTGDISLYSLSLGWLF